MPYDVTYMQNLDMIQINLFMKHKQAHRQRKQTSGHQRGKWVRRNKLRKSLGLADTNYYV